MELNHDICYSAIKSKDERFDGRFFTGVLTTGIYCRPICPALTPRVENVQFYGTAAEAAEAGFRPCLRCRPESSPGSPEWEGGSAIVSRAVRLINEGVMDEDGLESVAAHLHLGSRQLRRLFVKHLGVPPVAVVQTRRLHFAKKLIDETNLPMTEIAFSAGYQSVRRFNDAFQKTYGRSPTELRRQNVDEETAVSHLQLKLAYRPPFNWDALIQFLQARAIPGVEVVEANRYKRTVQFGERDGVIEVTPIRNKNYLQLSVPSHLARHLQTISERIRRLFDLQADPIQIENHLCQDALLAPIFKQVRGLRLPGCWDGFEIGVRAIIGQQVSVKGATTISGRLVERLGTPVTAVSENSHLTHIFPTPMQIVNGDLTNLGMPTKRAETIRTLAQAVLDGTISFNTPTSLEEAIDSFVQLPGIGDWTAQYMAMRALGEPDAFPAGDLILRRAASETEKPLTEKQLRERAEDWRPWRAYAAVYLWKSYA